MSNINIKQVRSTIQRQKSLKGSESTKIEPMDIDNSDNSSEGNIVDIQVNEEKQNTKSMNKKEEKSQVEEQKQVKPTVPTVQIAFDGFTKSEIEQYQNEVGKIGIQIVNMPTKLTQKQANKNLIIVSQSGNSNSFANKIVNIQWLNDCIAKKQVLTQECEKYGFLFTEKQFFIYANNEDPQSIQNQIMKQQGTILTQFDEVKKQPAQTFVILATNDGFVETNKEVQELIKEFQITFEVFEKLTILSSKWLQECISKNELVDIQAFNLGTLFKIYSQGDKSVYYEVKEKINEGGRGQGKMKKRTVPELIETFSRMPANHDLILEDCVLHIYDSDIYNHGFKIANLLGANITDQILATYTTHVITKYITPQLKQHLSLIQNKSMEYANKHSRMFETSIAQKDTQVIGQTYSVKLVTIEWLEACLKSGKKVDEEQYSPEFVNDNSSLSNEDKQKMRKNYVQKRALFKNQIFTINEVTFNDQSDKEDLIEHMHRTIVENGGRVVPYEQNKNKGHFVIIDDGHGKDVWDDSSKLDQQARRIIHFRWVEECVKKNSIIDPEATVHCLPQPCRVPIKAFEKIKVMITLFEPNEKEEFSSLLQLYGFGVSKEIKKLVILVNPSKELKNSATIKHFALQTEKEMPDIVGLEWLMHAMKHQKIIDDPALKIKVDREIFKNDKEMIIKKK